MFSLQKRIVRHSYFLEFQTYHHGDEYQKLGFTFIGERCGQPEKWFRTKVELINPKGDKNVIVLEVINTMMNRVFMSYRDIREAQGNLKKAGYKHTWDCEEMVNLELRIWLGNMSLQSKPIDLLHDLAQALIEMYAHIKEAAL